jgi:sugar phosphate isomerase/epimerase
MMLTSRRLFLQGACAVGAASPMLAAVANAKPQAFFSQHKLPIGIQLYTLGDLTMKDLDGTLKAIARTGYKTVELAGYMGKTPKQLRTAFDAAGVKATSAHIGLAKGTDAEPKLFDDLGRVAADMHVIGATHIIAPAMNKPEDVVLPPGSPAGALGLAKAAAMMSEDQWKRMAKQLNDIGGKLKPHGIGFGYHNHNIEFGPVGGRTGFDILLAETDPSLVTFEMDIGWVAAAGKDPIALFDQHKGRFGLCHMKDVKADTVANFEFKMDPTEVGSGKLDWAKILPAAYKAGVRKFFVEQEAPFAFPRLESAAKCYAFLSKVKA